MKFTSLDIERFGLWTELHLSKLEGGLNVFYGPNEAGKTTLMDFVRSILYGLHEERLRYVFPFGGDREQNKGKRKKTQTFISGGSIDVMSPDGHFTIKRLFDPNDPQIGTDHTLSITHHGQGSTATHQENAALRTILSGIDEPTFNNVFTFGLDELRKLGTLDDTAAAEMLFRLSIGLDRISLIEVLRSLNKSRTQLLDPAESQQGSLHQMVAQHHKLTEELGQSRRQIWEYTRILTEQRKLDRIIGQINDELKSLRYDQRINEIAIHAGPIWDRRDTVRTQIAEMGTPIRVPEEALLELTEIEESIQKRKTQFSDLKKQYLDYQTKIKAVPVNETLWKLTPRIEIILEEETRIVEIDQQITQLENEATALENELRECEQHLRYGRRKTGNQDYRPPQTVQSSASASTYTAPQSSSSNKSISSPALHQRAAQTMRDMQYQPAPEPIRNLNEFRVYSRHVKKTQRNFHRSKQIYEELKERTRVLGEKLASEMSKLETTDLHETLERNSDRVNQLRKRQSIAQRIDEMSRVRKDLERQNMLLLQSQAIPAWGLMMLIGAAIVTVVLIVAHFTNGVHQLFGGIGALVCVAGLFVKVMIERQNSHKLEYNHRQLSLLVTQMDQAKQDAAAIDMKYPASGLSPDLRYQAAQQELATLEKLIPLEAQRKETALQFKAEQERLNRTKTAAENARKNWEDWLRNASLPVDWTPKQVRELIGRFGSASEVRRNLDRTYEDINQRVRDLRIITDRIDRVIVETNLTFADGMSYVDVLAQIRRELIACEEGFKKRQALAQERAKLKPQRKKVYASYMQSRAKKTELLSKYGAKTSSQLHKLAEIWNNYQTLLSKEEAVQRELAAAISGFCTEEVVASQMEPEVRRNLENRKEQIKRRIESAESHLREEAEKHGKFTLELQQLAQDQTAAKKQRELLILDRKIKTSIRTWQVQAVSCRILENIRKAYERERQPLALAETSDYFRRLTAGKYQRVWTPLGEDTLKIDDSGANTMDVSWLSRGTREQLFISLRLALSGSFTRHGSDLPLILDDVLVNFDTSRAKTAAKVLMEIAESGKQIILFTCHEHIARIFHKRDVPVWILPKFKDPKNIRVLPPASMASTVRQQKADNQPTDTDEYAWNEFDSTSPP
ncbi:MAG: AAA family ATPase [Planctomycetaceae bacterium]|nr:AAA family ATPase [Planctomycetaceae bacterium]